MLNFLKQTRKLINTKEATCIVLGNESCDLDSACSALCLAYLFQERAPYKHIKAKQFLPVLNIPRSDYPLKTEVHYELQKYEIPQAILTFRDDLHEDFIERSEFILVDHHVSPFVTQSVAIYDHRPKDVSAIFPKDCCVNMDLVGSCATLIAEMFLKVTDENMNMEKYGLACNLLRDTIILDTVNFSANAARFTKKDEEICCHLDCLLKSQPNFQTRDNVFQLLRRARADISTLTAAQLLRKDLKVLRNSSGSLGIALPGFPLKVQQFLKKAGAENALKAFAIEENCSIILLIGMFVQDDDSVERDIGLITCGENVNLTKTVEANLLACKEPALDLEHYENCTFMGGRFYKQRNVKATRKHILPIVKQTLENFHSE